jgi:hypothetical protein
MVSARLAPAVSVAPIALLPEAAESAHEPEGRFEETVDLGLTRLLALGRSGLTIIDGRDRVQLDAEGRWHRAWLDGRSYQRGLSGRVRLVDPRRRRGRQEPRIEVLEEAPEILERVVRRVQEAREQAPSPLPERISLALEDASRWTLERYRDERARYDALYRPISILPPDQSLSLVLQATLGCAWGRCRFCSLYAGETHRVRTTDELREHTRQARALWGRALETRRGVFLGQAAAFDVDPDRLTALLDVVRDEVGDAQRWPISMFGDFFSPKPAADALARLRNRGVVRVTLGLESGSERVLARLGKPVAPRTAIETALRIADADIRRGVTVLIGAGGTALEAEHVTETVRVLSAMRLADDEHVYLSPLHSRSNRGERLASRVQRLRSALRDAGVPARIALYDVRRFLH